MPYVILMIQYLKKGWRKINEILNMGQINL